MRYIVYGAGAIGGVIGARLFQHGAAVVLVARGEHLVAIQRSGLTLQSPLDAVTLSVPAVAQPSEIAFRDGDVVVLTTKMQQAATALDDLRTAAGVQLPIVCVQNGVAGPRMALRRFEHVYGAMVLLPSTHLHPGLVQAYSAPVPGIVDMGRYPAGEDALIAAVAADFRNAGFDSQVCPDVLRWQYGKLLDNLQNALQALCGAEVDYADLSAGLRAEAERCYAAAGIAWAPQAEVRGRAHGVLTLGQIGGQPRQGGSSWQSLARSAGSIETDFLNGEIALLGRLHGVPTPLNARLAEIAARAARERRPAGSLSVDDLRELVRS